MKKHLCSPRIWEGILFSFICIIGAASIMVFFIWTIVLISWLLEKRADKLIEKGKTEAGEKLKKQLTGPTSLLKKYLIGVIIACVVLQGLHPLQWIVVGVAGIIVAIITVVRIRAAAGKDS